jgi:hypothetical protein
MNNFTETQKFKPWVFGLIVLIVLISPIMITYRQMQEHATATLNYDNILIALIVPVVFISMFLIIKLDTTLDSEGVKFRFFPIDMKHKVILWEDISTINTRKYSPILDYLGWGIRFGRRGKGMAYNVSGNIGIQLVLKNNKKVLIGTQKQSEVDQFLRQLVAQKVITSDKIA